MSQSPRSPDNRLPGIHGLRALAATGIVLFHLSALAIPAPPVIGFVSTYFAMAVPLFFVLSGFSLSYSTGGHVGRPRWVQVYALKRYFRIAPMFYAILAFTLGFQLWRGAHPRLADVVLNLTFTFDFVPGKEGSLVFAGWTVGAEMVCYAVLPILLVMTRRVLPALAIAALGVAISLAAKSNLTAPGLAASYGAFSFIANLHYFAIGLFAFAVFDALRQRAVPAAYVAAGGFLAVILLFAATLIGGPFFSPLWALIFGVLCVWQALVPGSLCGSRPFVFIGERSFSVYLIHPLALIAFGPLAKPIMATFGAWAFPVGAVILLSCVYTVAAITYALIETPGMRLGARVIRRLERPRLEAAPETALETAPPRPAWGGAPATASRIVARME